MLKYILLLITLLIAGCVTKPVPTSTNYCARGETANCRPWTASEIAGATTRGHSNQPEEPK